MVFRWSCALDPAVIKFPIAATAFKFLIDGADSVNFFANFVNPPEVHNWNFMAFNYSSHINWGPAADVQTDPINAVFWPVTQMIKQVGTADIAAIYRNGSKVP